MICINIQGTLVDVSDDFFENKPRKKLEILTL